MLRATPSKALHIKSVSELQDPQTPIQTPSSNQTRKSELAQNLGLSKLKRNLVRLRPIQTKKGMGDDESVQTVQTTELEDKGKASSIELDAQNNPQRTPANIEESNMGSSSATIPQNLRLSLESERNDGKSSTLGKQQRNIPRSRATKRNITCKKTEIQNAGTFEEARLLMVGLPSTTTNAKAEDKNIALGFKEAARLTPKNNKNKDTPKQATTKDPVSLPELKQAQSTTVGLDMFRKLVFGPNVEDRVLRKHAIQALRGLTYSTKLLRPPPLSYIKFRQVMIREMKNKNQKTLILDLDETLVHVCGSHEKPDKILTLTGDASPTIPIKIRPYAREFIRKMRDHFELLVFTASIAPYADAVVKELDPESKYISYVLDRSYCLETKNRFHIKDLRIIKNRDLKNMIIVDNLIHSFGFQLDNGVPILDWRGDRSDQELKFLMKYLLEAKQYDDVREYNKEKLKLTELANYTLEESS